SKWVLRDLARGSRQPHRLRPHDGGVPVVLAGDGQRPLDAAADVRLRWAEAGRLLVPVRRSLAGGAGRGRGAAGDPGGDARAGAGGGVAARPEGQRGGDRLAGLRRRPGGAEARSASEGTQPVPSLALRASTSPPRPENVSEHG